MNKRAKLTQVNKKRKKEINKINYTQTKKNTQLFFARNEEGIKLTQVSKCKSRKK
jgi:hypothetical protein